MKYTIGILKNNNHKEGVKVFDNSTGKFEFISLQHAKEKLIAGENIVGLKLKNRTNYRRPEIVYTYVFLQEYFYDTRKLPVVDTENNTLVPGVPVVIGRIGTTDMKYIIVDSSEEIKLISGEELDIIKPVGYSNGHLIRSCKNIYMTLGEFTSSCRVDVKV